MVAPRLPAMNGRPGLYWASGAAMPVEFCGYSFLQLVVFGWAVAGESIYQDASSKDIGSGRISIARRTFYL
jgi:hypothetical protein